MTVFRKTNRSVRKSIIAYARKYAFQHEDVNGNKEKQERFTRSQSVGLVTTASSLYIKGNKAKFVFLPNRLVFLNTFTNVQLIWI